MAEGDGHLYNNFKEQLLNGLFDLSDDSAASVIKCILVTGHSLNIDTHAVLTDVSGDEEVGTGYTAGGVTLANQVTAQDNANDRASFDADNVTWTGLDVGTPNYVILYDDSQSDTLIGAWEITTASNGGDYTLQWHANGIILLT